MSTEVEAILSTKSLEGFILVECLSCDINNPVITLLFQKDDDDTKKGIVRVRKSNFNEGISESLLRGMKITNSDTVNPPYLTGSCQLPLEDSADQPKLGITYPATELHIMKARPCQFKWIRETPKLYLDITLPNLVPTDRSRLGWVDKILSGEKEPERTFYRDEDPLTGFVLLADMKWDLNAPDKDNHFYLTAIVNRIDLLSLRDLTTSHLAVLENMRDSIRTFLTSKFGYGPETYRMHFHYQPSYYHLHLHLVKNDILDHGSLVGRAHLLDDVIDNIKLMDDYYQRANLTMMLPERQALLYPN